MVFAIGSEDGSIFVYDLSRSTSSPIFSLPSSTKKNVSITSEQSSSSRSSREANPCVTTLAFNPKIGTLLASGDEAGKCTYMETIASIFYKLYERTRAAE